MTDETLDLPDKNNIAKALNVPRLTPNDIPQDLVDAIKRQVVEEMKNDEKRRQTETEMRQAEARKEHDEYVVRMKASPDPWVEIEGWGETKNGVKVELEWNDAFVEFLKSQGITGADEDQIVQKWIALLMQDMSSKMQENETEYE